MDLSVPNLQKKTGAFDFDRGSWVLGVGRPWCNKTLSADALEVACVSL